LRYRIKVPRLALDFFIVSLLLLGGIFMVASKETMVSRSVQTVATTTPSLSEVADLATFSPIIFPDPLPEIEEKKIEVPVKTTLEIKKEKPVEAISPSTVVAPIGNAITNVLVATTTEPVPMTDSATSVLRDALVNIVCYAPFGSRIHSISGSGVFVDPKGIILTNAHIAQHLLLREQGVSCTVRTGAPAIDAYKASLVFISGAWVEENAKLLATSMPVGTGEHDFALLVVTKSASTVGKPLPSEFPFIPLATTFPTAGTPVVIAGYGAQFLVAQQIQFSLYPTVVFGMVKDIFTFGSNTVDVMSLGGSAAAQQGSSGGGVADANGKLIGTIVTSTQEKVTSDRTLDAITASYMRRAYMSEAGEDIDALFSRPIEVSILNFETKKKELEAILRAHLL
jgi:S1-C subfamily serine protease